MTEEEKKIHIAYNNLELTVAERNAMYDLFMCGYNAEDGHLWVRWIDVERLIVDFKSQKGE